MKKMNRHNLLSAALLSIGLLSAACEDPAKDVPKATVESAKPVATTAASAKPTATATAAATATATATAAATAAAAPEKPANASDLDPAATKVQFIGSKVTGKHEGNFEKVTGWIALDGDKVETGKAYVEIDMATFKLADGGDKLAEHLKSADFFDVATNPTATFTTTEIKAGGDKGATHTVTGNLKLRGTEKSISFPATIAAAGDKVTVKAEFAINRKDFNIVYAGKADDLIRDDVVIKLDLAVAKKK